jgi:hypothetical protein
MGRTCAFARCFRYRTDLSSVERAGAVTNRKVHSMTDNEIATNCRLHEVPMNTHDEFLLWHALHRLTWLTVNARTQWPLLAQNRPVGPAYEFPVHRENRK